MAVSKMMHDSAVFGRPRVAVAVAAAVAGLAVLLAVEIQLARSGSRLPDLELTLDRPGSGKRLVWLGDSTASGVGASAAGGALPGQVADGLAAAGVTSEDVSVAALAVSGARVADVLSEQVPKVAALRPDLVLISVGANDAIHLTGRGAFRRTYEKVLRALPDGVPVVTLGVPDMGAIPRFAQPLRAVSGWRGRQLDTEVRRVATGAGAVYVDIAGRTGPPFRRHPDRYFAADDFHPSDAGYGLWAEAVVEVLAKAGLPPD